MGGRLHPGLAVERLLKQRPKLISCLSRRPCDRWCLRDDEHSLWLGVRGYVLRFEVHCEPACRPVLFPRGLPLIAFAFWVSARLFRTGCLPFCVLAALGGFVPCALLGVRPPAFSVPDAGHSV